MIRKNPEKFPPIEHRTDIELIWVRAFWRVA